MTSSSIKSCINARQQQIADCAQRCGRSADEISLLAVSKTRSTDEIRQAVAAGCTLFGESYVQEAVEKIHQLGDLNLEWHYIGPIQSNKTRDIARYFDWVHSVDREKIAQRLNDQRPEDQPALNICIQVNISEEPNKSGVLPGELAPLVESIAALPRLRLRGLMAIPQRVDQGDEEQQRVPFRLLRESLLELKAQGLDTLSMGMTNDMCAAILEGSTIVRIGTGIFGPRK